MKLTQLTENQVVHCKTQEEAIRVCNIAHELGWRWSNGTSYEKTHVDSYKDNTCYHFSKRQFSGVSFYRREGKEIIDATKIENMKQLPKYFVIKRDLDNPLWEDYIEWLNKTYRRDWKGREYNYYGVDDSIAYNGTNCHDLISEFQNNPTVITLDFWNECVKISANKKQTYPIEAKKMQEVFDIACKSWKEKLAKEFGTQMMLGEVCNVTEELKKEMLKASTTEQRPIVESLFEEDLSVNVNSKSLVYFLALRSDGEYTDKGFVLSEQYDWKIVIDNKNKIVLIPTKKSR